MWEGETVCLFLFYWPSAVDECSLMSLGVIRVSSLLGVLRAVHAKRLDSRWQNGYERGYWSLDK